MNRTIKLSAVSTVALATAIAVVGLTSPTWASPSVHHKIGTSQIQNQAVTASKLAPNAVTSSTVQDGSLTDSDVAPNTFLPANGEAANSQQLQGHSASDFVQGTGAMQANAVNVLAGNSSPQIFAMGFGKIVVNCDISGKPTMSFVSQQTADVYQLVVSAVTFGSPNGTSDIHTSNALTAGTSFTEANPNGLPQQVTFQVHYVDNQNVGHFATAWVTGQDLGGLQCAFFGQELTTA